MNNTLIELRHVSKVFKGGPGLAGWEYRQAVKDISFTVGVAEIVALIGQSGAGKTTIANLIMQISNLSDGELLYRGKPIAEVSPVEIRKKIQILFQDPYSTLNPAMNVETILKEPVVINERLSAGEVSKKIERLLSDVSLPLSILKRYPHQLSGGQRQRVALARALALEPELIVCDEPLSAVDRATREKIIRLIRQKNISGTSFLIIAHDLDFVEEVAGRVIVIYQGRLVESGDVREVFDSPRHEYTKRLMAERR